MVGNRSRQGILHRFGSRMAISQDAEPVTLLEGDTPLIPAPTLAKKHRLACELYLKFEGLNPTGSFKDRGMTAAITQARADGAHAVICASTGNTAASAAAYAARAGLRCIVVVPEAKVALGKLAGAIAYGAMVVSVRGSFDDALRMVRDAAERSELVLVNSLNPARLEGQKTGAFEICETLGDSPDWLCLPVGNAGNISAYWLGFREYFRDGCCKSLPRLLGAQAEGAAPMVRGHVVERPETVATAIRIGNPARWNDAARALEESDGVILAVSDTEILAAQRDMATLEGVFCEPSSAAGLAGLVRAVAEGRVDVAGARVVCVVTGHGLKDPDAILSIQPAMETIEPTLDALMRLLDRVPEHPA
jgi:threonine synthase